MKPLDWALIAATVALCWVMARAVMDESVIRETLDFRAAILQVQNAGKP